MFLLFFFCPFSREGNFGLHRTEFNYSSSHGTHSSTSSDPCCPFGPLALVVHMVLRIGGCCCVGSSVLRGGGKKERSEKGGGIAP